MKRLGWQAALVLALSGIALYASPPVPASAMVTCTYCGDIEECPNLVEWCSEVCGGNGGVCGTSGHAGCGGGGGITWTGCSEC